MPTYVVYNDADRKVLESQGIPDTQIRYIGFNNSTSTANGYGAPAGLATVGAGDSDLVFVGQAGKYAYSGATVLEGGNRQQTAQLVANYQQNPVASGQLNGKSIVQQFLARYGLGSLVDEAWQQYVDSGNSLDYLKMWITTTPEFERIYPAYNQMASEGRGISLDAYQAYQNTMFNLAKQYGVPDGFMDNALIGQMLLGGKDTQEVEQDLNDYADALAHPLVQQRLIAAGLDPSNLTPGGLAAFFTDPKKAQPLLERQFTAAQLGAASDLAGVSISDAEANSLALQGVTAAQGRAAFPQVGAAQPLLKALPGSAEASLSNDLAAQALVASDAQAAAKLQRRQQRRLAPFQAGGGFTASPTGGGQGAAQGA